MIKLLGYFSGFSSKADGSAGLRFSTQEISAEEFANFKRDLNTFGWILFSPEGEMLPTVPKEKVKDDRKSQATRLRNVLWRLNEQNNEENTKEGKPVQDDEDFYQQETEKVIEYYKSKLKPR